MTKIIIFEGTGTSGKSVMQSKINNYYISKRKSVKIIDEYQITKNLHFQEKRNKISSIEQLKKIINSLDINFDYIIFDRFHFAHAASLNLALEDFKEIELALKNYDAKVIFFYYSSSSLVKRVRNSLKYRKGTGFETFLNNIIKGSRSIEEEDKKIFEHFNGRMNRLKKIINKTDLPILQIDVSKINTIEKYDSLVPKIIDFIEN